MDLEKNYLIGIDASTTACKAVVWDATGTPVGEGRANLKIEMPRPGWHEQSAEDWWRGLVRCVRRAMRGIDPGRLAGLAIAHQRETFVPVDAKGNALRPAILWMDERAAGILPQIEAAVGKEAFHQITGKPISANLTALKIAWLRQHEPAFFAQAAQFLDVHAYLVERLTGTARTGWGCADPTGLFDIQRQVYSPSVLDAVGIREQQLPKAFPPGMVIGKVSRVASKRTGLPEGLPVIAGLGDGQAGGLGANICQPGAAYLTLGTSVIGGTYAGKYVVDPAFRTMMGGIPGSYLLETVLLGGAYTIDWLLKTFLGCSAVAANRMRARLDQSLEAIPPGSQGLVVVPYWNTVMNPYWDATASGIVLGWRGFHTPKHLYHAILEGIALELRLHFDGVERALGLPLDDIVAMGGGARNERWCQMIADITGKPVWRSASGETTTLGAAVLAAAGSGVYSSIAEAAAAMSRRKAPAFLPDPHRHAAYARLYHEVYLPIYPALRSSLANLAHYNPTP